jgi:hypothetical protein
MIWKNWKNVAGRLRLWFTQNNETAANYLQIMFILGGIIAFFWQLHDKNKSDRNQQAFAFIARYYQEPLASARQKVESLWYDKKL